MTTILAAEQIVRQTNTTNVTLQGKNEIPLKEIKRERLDLVINRAGIPGKNFEERNKWKKCNQCD